VIYRNAKKVRDKAMFKVNRKGEIIAWWAKIGSWNMRISHIILALLWSGKDNVP
jgi:hypothetical protein